MVTTISVIVCTLLILYFYFQSLQSHLDKKMQEIDGKMNANIDNASNKAIKDSFNFVQDSSFKEVTKLLEPIKEQLRLYETKMDQMMKEETVERTKMGEMMKMVTDLNRGFSDEAKAFAKAIRGDIRALGKFGEDKVELVLTASGYNEDVEYLKQTVLKSEDGDIKPDFTIKLPLGKAVFIDSKMPLDHFMKYLEMDDDSSKVEQARDFVRRMQAHVNDLSKKNYHKCTVFKSMDFILMFVGSDRAISLALDYDPELQRTALKKGILIVGPTTLMASLKSIEFLYREERQVENLEAISIVGSHLYTKLVYFVQNLKDSQKAFEKAQLCLKTALDHLNRGEKSILADAEKLNELGKFSDKPLPRIEE